MTAMTGLAIGTLRIGLLWLSTAAAAPTSSALVEPGASTTVIHHAADAPGSVRFAAAELQRVIRLATDVELAITTESGPRMISLGSTAAAQAAGISAADLPDDSFRLVTRDGCVYIVGKDSPRNRTAWGGGEARGTLLGAYAFLEQVVGVRWLAPGDQGEDIPRHTTLAMPALDQTQVPSFASRMLGGGIGDRADWTTRNGGGGWRIQYGHNWDTFPPRAVLRANPEFLALNQGSRIKVPDDDTSPFQPKFCTTNPGLVQAFAQSIIDWFDRNPQARFVSISPSDGPGWCQCPTCSQHTLAGPSAVWGDYGGWKRGVTPLIVRFYNDVARLVAQRHPDRVLGGFIYYDFTFPYDDMPALEPNVAIMLAPLQQYGLTRYKPELRDQFERLCAAWSKESARAGYYGASTWLRVGIGAPLGPSRSLLKHTFATLQRSGFAMVSYYALPWDSCPVHNYLAMKLMWNAQADVDALYHDYLGRAYGPGAAAMDALYSLIDREMEQAKRASPTVIADYEMTSELALRVYRPHWAAIEGHYREALARADTPTRRARIEAFGDNLVILHHVLAQADVLERPAESLFHRTPQQYREFLLTRSNSQAVRTMQQAGAQGAITGLFVPGQRKLTLPRLERVAAPRIDGDLGDSAWTLVRNAEQGLAIATHFVSLADASPARQTTQVIAAYDDRNLYVAWRCATPTTRAQPRPTDDAAIEQDDSVTLMIRVQDESSEYWKLAINAANARVDARCRPGHEPDPAATLACDSAVLIGEGFWSAELSIPLSALLKNTAASPVGTTWRVNLIRMDAQSSELSAWSGSSEDSAWNPADFGSWYFPR
jgi:hypothetical protein